jgi:hypothetical protein
MSPDVVPLEVDDRGGALLDGLIGGLERLAV